MLLLLLIYVVLRALWNIDVYLISTLVNKGLYYCYYYYYKSLYNKIILHDRKCTRSTLNYIGSILKSICMQCVVHHLFTFYHVFQSM